MYVFRSSVYGITASLIKGCTVCHLIGNVNEKVDAPIKPLDYQDLYEFSQKVKKDGIGLIIIDEVSTMTTRMFHLLDLRFRQLMEKDDIPFGGVKVVLCGDFMQNESIGGDSLYVNSLLVARYNHKFFIPPERNRTQDAYFPGGVMQRTAEVFNQAKLFFLKKQFRCKENDPEHMDMIRRLHKGEGLTIKDLKNFNFIDKNLMKNDPEWRYAPMLVTSNFERTAIIEQKAILFAKDKGEVVFRWKLNAKILQGEGNDEDLYEVNDSPGLWAYFVKGAPLYITINLNPNKHIANLSFFDI